VSLLVLAVYGGKKEMKTNQGVYSDTDLLTWVGGRAYPTIEAFVEEARLVGCSRRLPSSMNWVVPGKTRIFLAHKNGCKDEAYSVVFGFFTLNSVHVIYDNITCGRNLRNCRPILHPGVRLPRSAAEFDEYIVKRKIILTHREEGAIRKDPLAKLLEVLWDGWLKEVINLSIKQGVRRIPWSMEADNIERLCGGASNLGSGRYPGAYASDELGDWVLDQIFDWLSDKPDLPDEHFWIAGKRRAHKRAPAGASRSGRINIDAIHRTYGKPPKPISGITVFDKPYPLYFHPLKASFRGFRRIDGNALLLKVNLPQYIHRTKRLTLAAAANR
jgi:hypothetical protein